MEESDVLSLVVSARQLVTNIQQKGGKTLLNQIAREDATGRKTRQKLVTWSDNEWLSQRSIDTG